LTGKGREENSKSSGVMKEGVIQYGETRIICSYCGEEIKTEEKITTCPYFNSPIVEDDKKNRS
jgi:hypothetical protein